MVKLFLDTEFTDLKKDCDLISIGIVASAGDGVLSGFYAESIDFSEDKCSDFVKGNILPKLVFSGEPSNQKIDDGGGYYSQSMCGTEEDIGLELTNWIKQFVPDDSSTIEVWSDCLAYDWVLFCHLFDDVLPDYIYYIPFDIATLMNRVGIDPDVNREQFAAMMTDDGKKFIESMGSNCKHNSLFDVTIIYYCYTGLMNM